MESFLVMKLNMIAFFAAAAILFHTVQSANYGSDFYIGSMRNYGGSTTSYKFHLATLSETEISYSVESYLGTNVASGTVSKSSPTVVTISDTNYITNTNTERSDGLHLTATGPVSVLVENYQLATIGEYTVYPKQEFGGLYQYEYYTVAPTTNLVSNARSQILLVGTADNTVVTVTPTVAVTVPSDLQSSFSSQVVLNAGQTQQFVLHELQTFFFRANVFTHDLTGTAIVSDKPLTVIAGHECANIPASQVYCEHVEEQIPPTVTWGSQFLIRSFTGKNDYTYFKVVTSVDSTIITHNCGGSTTEQTMGLAGATTTISVNNGVNCYLEADNPILISQMMTGGGSTTGDPAISLVSPIEQYTNEVIFHTPSLGQNFESNYINILTANSDTVMLDGSAVTDWETITFNGNTVGYSKAISVSVQTHHVSSSYRFHVMVYGYTSNALAGYTFSAGVGIQQQLVGGGLQVKPWFGNILGGVPFLLKGPRLKIGDTIKCQLNELMIPCQRVDDDHAMCVSPRLTFTRRITLRMFTNDEKYGTDARFYSLSIEQDKRVSIVNNHFFLVSNDIANLVWNRDSVIPAETNIDPATLLVNITIHKVTDGFETILDKVTQVATGIPNIGEAQVTIPLLESDEHIDFCVFELTVYDDPSKPSTLISTADSNIGQWCTDVWISFSDPSQKDDTLFAKCNEWAATEPLPFVRDELLSRTASVPCPPTRAQVLTPNSGLVLDTQYNIVKFFHPSADQCFRQRTITAANLGSGNECCYSSSGSLIVGPSSGGSINKVDPHGSGDYWTTLRQHFKEDIVPYIMCCQGAKKNCKAYYDRRPSDDGSRFQPPVPACVYGDPHIVTLDLVKYTFNGRGEFILVETPDFEPSFTIHARMVPVKDQDNNDGKATVFSAIVAKQGDSDVVQFELQTIEEELKIVTYVAGEEIDFSELTVQEFNNVTVTDTGNNTLNAIFSTGAYITVSETNGLISTLVVYLPDMYRGQTRGLMGNYNNDTSDDLIRKGTNVKLSPEHSSLKLIHEFFGLSYIIENATNGLFTYNNGDSFSKYYKPYFVPLYETTFSSPALEQEANDICGTDKFCKFDIAVSGKTEIGQNTKKGSDDFEMLQELSKPIVCEPPCANGACVDTNVCSCSEGYVGLLCDQMNATGCSLFDPCENGATCGEIAGSVICMCPPGYLGYYCQDIDPSYTPPPPPSTSIDSMVSKDTASSVMATMATASDGRGIVTGSSMTQSSSRQRPVSSMPPTRGSLGGESPVSGTVIGAVIAVVIVIVLVIGVSVLVAIACVITRKSRSKMMVPGESTGAKESQVMGLGAGKANPAYHEFTNEEDEEEEMKEADFNDEDHRYDNIG